MKFVIVGYGRVGTRTCRILAEEGHEVIVVDNDYDKVQRARKEGFTVVEGDGEEEDVLEEAGIADADAIAALTPDLNVNFTACMVGKHHGARTVLRIDEDYREDIYEKYANDVDEVIYPERLGAAGAKTAMLGGDFNVLADITEKLQFSVFEIPADSPLVGKRVVEVDLPEEARIYAHGHANESLTIPMPTTSIEAGDQLAVVVETERVGEVRDALSA
ncbi:TrkA family potassium uptake protein [Haloarchaeobius sp. HME9146]|uniref:potassium channel family protein n=1 Tax=Haloarchaeobius sp. HME9146 TaxID=2978732 RepID=UPI0021C16697|nr:TrkA family potassium uptake protein [Haloarchaeobius sp. HME9146]MCT9094468.1 TrkA family potassium uptake protein [Haloarchaeobius sp. HME9146]